MPLAEQEVFFISALRPLANCCCCCCYFLLAFNSTAGAAMALGMVLSTMLYQYNRNIWYLDASVALCIAVGLFGYGIRWVFSYLGALFSKSWNIEMLSQDNLSHFIFFFFQQASGESFTCKGKIPSTRWSIWLDIVYIFLKINRGGLYRPFCSCAWDWVSVLSNGTMALF